VNTFLRQHVFWHAWWDHSLLIGSQMLISLYFIDKVRPGEVTKSKYNIILPLANELSVNQFDDRYHQRQVQKGRTHGNFIGVIT
jgi:hypothetical protein